MNATLYKRLESCHAEQAWEHVRDIVAVQLMGENVFPVPYLRDANAYDIGYVILKAKRTAVEKLTGGLASALPAGHLSKFVPETSGRTSLERLSNVSQDKDVQLNQVYEFHEMDMKHGVKKSITVQLWGCQRWKMDYPPQDGDIIVDLEKRGYVNLNRIFLVTEVFYVTEVKINVNIGETDDNYIIKGRIPIGFKLIRYKLQDSKALGSSKHVKTSSWGGRWIKNLKREHDDPPPLDPFQERRANYGLTIESEL